MIKEIVTDVNILAKKSEPCTFNELGILKNRQVVEDMIDTAIANEPECIGLAAIQIDEYKRIIIMKLEGRWEAMLNPTYTPVRSAGVKRYKEGCLSFPETIHKNTPERRRWKKIHLTYKSITGYESKITLMKLNAVIAQHEIDHCNGKLI